MNTSPLVKILPLVIIVIALVGGVIVFKERAAVQARLKALLERAQIEATTKLPEPTPFIPVKNESDRLGIANTNPSLVTPTVMPTGVTPTVTPVVANSKNGTKVAKSTAAATNSKTTVISQETVCTPVYGMANTCAEHTVVETGLDTNVFASLAGLSYLGGLVAFIKAKRA